VRIVAGERKGARLDVPAGRDTRPTSDRLRESLFAMLGDVSGLTVLDPFAGTGALGLEALSRGAAHATFVESAAPSLASLRTNIEQLGASSAATVHRGDALRFIETVGETAFDVAFADPPYRKGLAAQVAERWREARFSRILAIEHEAVEAMPAGGRTRRYGDTALTFYRL
jgi:16S rRNA (guanine966-N2)-methyltransferase